MSRRSQQVASALHRAVQQVMLRGLADPRITGSITITGVDVAEDMRTATIKVSIMPEEAENLTMHGLKDAVRHVRRQVGDLVDMPRVPELRFKLDRSLKTQAAVINAIARASAELAQRTGTGAGGAAEAAQPGEPGEGATPHDSEENP